VTSLSAPAPPELHRAPTSTTSADAPGPEGVVVLEDVRKSFGPSTALVDLRLHIPAGRITVLLGPNGAGKTTAIRTITGAFAPDSGQVRTFGLDPQLHGAEVRARCGVVSAKPALYDRLSGLDNLRYAAELYRLGRGASVDRRIAERAARFGIEASLGQQVGGYSTGMKTRLALARSVLHDPDLLLYDEPTSGLDPESSHAVLELIREMTADGTTVVMCTHLLLEAEGLADQVVVLQDGTALVSGRPEDLVQAIWSDTVVRVTLEDVSHFAVLDQVAGVERWELATADGPAGQCEIHLEQMGLVPDVVAALAAAGARVTRVEPLERSLEDLYFAVRRTSGGTRLGAMEGSAV
jgi:ABC-2 type transport system ATP-binding protein